MKIFITKNELKELVNLKDEVILGNCSIYEDFIDEEEIVDVYEGAISFIKNNIDYSFDDEDNVTVVIDEASVLTFCIMYSKLIAIIYKRFKVIIDSSVAMYKDVIELIADNYNSKIENKEL